MPVAIMQLSGREIDGARTKNAFRRRSGVGVCIALLGAGVLAVAGCVRPPANKVAKAAIPPAPQWSQDLVGGEYDGLAWTKDFSDEQLDALVRESLSGSFTLQAALHRLEAAAALNRIDGSGLFPSLNVSHGGTRAMRNSADGVSKISPISETFNTTARATWEFDLWGRVRNTARAGLAEFQASQEDYRAARLSLVATLVGTWYDATEAQLLVELSHRTLESFENNLRVVEDNFRRGVARALDVHLIRANVASARSSYEQSVRSRDALIRRLETLAGRYPASALKPGSKLPVELAGVPSGVPADVLWRRPDLAAAERRLAALDERVAESFKARLPNIVLSATGGTSASTFDGSFDLAKNEVWNAAYTVTLPLFQGGRLHASQKRARALFDQAADNFAALTLGAYREVENALQAEESLKREYEAQETAARESIAAERLAWDQYERGLGDIIAAVESQRRSIAAQRSLIQVTNDRIQNRVTLHLALGGGLEYPSQSR